MNDPQRALTLQLLEWIDQGNHPYKEVLEVWKSSCPRLTVWEDACEAGLVDAMPGMAGTVFLTQKGKAFLMSVSSHSRI
nr:hypothetical protein [Noviherbaspirillum aerium]